MSFRGEAAETASPHFDSSQCYARGRINGQREPLSPSLLSPLSPVSPRT